MIVVFVQFPGTLTMRPIDLCRLSLAACAAVGICFMVAALVLVPALPYFQLDVVLTPEQLTDVQTRQTTLALLKKVSGNTWLLWFVAGLVVTGWAAIGWVASRRVA